MLEENTLVSVILLTEDAKDEDVFNSLFLEIVFYATYGSLFGGMESRSFTPYPYAEDAYGEYDTNLDTGLFQKNTFVLL